MIAASNNNLSELVNQGKFRKDLYYRLNVVPLEVPPLRERKEDKEERERQVILDALQASRNIT